MKRDIPLRLSSGEEGQLGVAVLLNRDDLVEGGLAEVIEGEADLRWALYCEIRVEQFDRFAARKAPPQPAVHLMKGEWGVSHVLVVCESDGFQLRVVVPLLGPDAAQFAHAVEVRHELTLLLSDGAGRATFIHWGRMVQPVGNWVAEALAEPEGLDGVLDEVIELSIVLTDVDALPTLEKCNRIELVGVSVYTPPQLDDVLRARVTKDMVDAPLH